MKSVPRRIKENITQQELETMQSVADELGIVSRNFKLFGQLQKTNQQLEVANENLKELDQRQVRIRVDRFAPIADADDRHYGLPVDDDPGRFR